MQQKTDLFFHSLVPQHLAAARPHMTTIRTREARHPKAFTNQLWLVFMQNTITFNHNRRQWHKYHATTISQCSADLHIMLPLLRYLLFISMSTVRYSNCLPGACHSQTRFDYISLGGLHRHTVETLFEHTRLTFSHVQTYGECALLPTQPRNIFGAEKHHKCCQQLN